MSVKLIAVDMDGTFLSNQKAHSHERFMAQHQQMKVQGIHFVITGGNQYYQLISFFPEAANEVAFVAENGGWVVSEGKDVLNGELPRDAFTTAVEHLPTRPGVEIIAYGKNSAHTLKKYDDAMKTVTEMYYHRLECIDNFNNLEDIFSKLDLNLSGELIPQVQEALHETIGNIVVPIHTGNGSIDLIIPGVRKANGLRRLQESWEIDDSEMVAFGDGGNDTEMLRQVGSGFAVENASSAVVAATKYRAGSNNHEGVLGVIDKVLKRGAPFNQWNGNTPDNTMSG